MSITRRMWLAMAAAAAAGAAAMLVRAQPARPRVAAKRPRPRWLGHT